VSARSAGRDGAPSVVFLSLSVTVAFVRRQTSQLEHSGRHTRYCGAALAIASIPVLAVLGMHRGLFCWSVSNLIAANKRPGEFSHNVVGRHLRHAVGTEAAGRATSA
jgi:hypothetical protein